MTALEGALVADQSTPGPIREACPVRTSPFPNSPPDPLPLPSRHRVPPFQQAQNIGGRGRVGAQLHDSLASRPSTGDRPQNWRWAAASAFDRLEVRCFHGCRAARPTIRQRATGRQRAGRRAIAPPLRRDGSSSRAAYFQRFYKQAAAPAGSHVSSRRQAAARQRASKRRKSLPGSSRRQVGRRADAPAPPHVGSRRQATARQRA